MPEHATTRPSPSATATPHCTARDCSPATASNCRTRRTCTCSSRAARSTLEGAGAAARRRRRAVHRVRRPARHRDRARGNPGLGDACGSGCRVTASRAGLVGIVLLAGCSSNSPTQPSPRRRRTPSRPRRLRAARRRSPSTCPSDLAQAPFDETAAGVGAQGLDDVGVGADAQGPPGGLDTRRRPVWSRCPATGQVVKLTPKPGAAPQQSTAPRRAGPAARAGVRGFDALRRRERSDRRLRLRQRRGHQPRTVADGPARRPEPRAARRLRARAEERRRRTRRRGVLLDRLDGQHLRRGPHRQSAAGDHHADPARRRAGRSRSRPACATAPVSRSRRTARCGRRSTIATTSPYPDGPSYGQVVPTTSTTIRPSRSARADARPRIGLALLQSRRRSGQPAVHPRRPDQRRRHADSTAPRCRPIEQSLGAHSAPLGLSFVDGRAARAVRARRVGRRARFVEPAAAAGARGVVLPLARRQLWAISRPSSAAFRPTTAHGGADRSRRSSDPTARCTSPTTTPTPSTDWPRRDASRTVEHRASALGDADVRSRLHRGLTSPATSFRVGLIRDDRAGPARRR